MRRDSTNRRFYLTLIALSSILLFFGGIIRCSNASTEIPVCVLGLGTGCTGGTTSGSVGGPLNFSTTASFFIVSTTYVLLTTGGTPPYTFSVATANPINATGSFNPTTSYSTTSFMAPNIPATLTLQVSDSSSPTQTQTLNFNVCYQAGNCP